MMTMAKLQLLLEDQGEKNLCMNLPAGCTEATCAAFYDSLAHFGFRQGVLFSVRAIGEVKIIP